MKIAVFSTQPYDKEYLNKFNQEENQELKHKLKHELVYFEAPLHADTVNLTVGFEAVCVFVNDKLDKNIIEKLAKNGIKLIALRCAGFNNVDKEAAKNHHIKVVRVPAYSPQAVAEHAVALILTLNRKTHKAYNRVRENNFSLDKLIGFNLYQKTVGVIGTGQIGTAFCEIIKGFGAKIIAYDIKKSEELANKGIIYKTLDEVLQESDIISLHCPLMPETHHLIDSEKIAKMKTGVMLINTSRGALLKTKDAINALKTGKLGYLGIDVYEQEEHLFFKDLSETFIEDEMIGRLMTFPNVLITAHQGFLTTEALTQIATTTLNSITDFEKGLPLKNEVK
jgi:D-lactate dehydrogenase